MATKAVCQAVLHMAKVPAFSYLRSYPNLVELGAVTVLMGVVVIPGTLLGKRLLKHVSQRRFIALYRLALLAAGLKVLFADGLMPVCVRAPSLGHG